MRNRYWIGGILVLLILCGGLSFWSMRPRSGAKQIQILSEGQVLYTLDLSQDRQITVTTDTGTNTVTIRDGRVAVTAADCPDHYCMERGWCDGGTQIVCLPNRLVIRFLGDGPVDAVAG